MIRLLLCDHPAASLSVFSDFFIFMNNARGVNSLKISPDLLLMVGENPILTHLLVFLYIGSYKGDILLPSFDTVM